MSTSLEDMQQRMAGGGSLTPSTKAPPSSAAPKGSSLAEMQKRLAPPVPGVLDIAKGVMKDLPKNAVKDAQGAVKALGKEAVKEAQGAVNLFKQTANDYSTAISNDVKRSQTAPSLINAAKGVMDLVGSLQVPVEATGRMALQTVQAGVAKLGSIVAEHAAPDDERTPEQKRLGVPNVKPKLDLKIHQEDVKNTIEGINNGLEALFGASLMELEGRPFAELPKYREPLLDVTERAIRQQRREAGLPPVQGKPQVTLSQAQAAMRDSTHELIEPMAADGAKPKAGGPKTTTIPLELVKTQLDLGVRPVVDRIVAEGGGRTTGDAILGHLHELASNTHDGEAYAAVIEGIRKNTKDVPVTFVRGFPENVKSTGGLPLSGYYDGETHSVHIDMNATSSITHTIVHELEHAATARYVRRNPNAPLVKRLRDVVWEVKKRALRMGELIHTDDTGSGVPRLRHYGLTNEREFLSELKSNPDFIDFLARSEAHASSSWKGIKIFQRIADLFRQMLGIKDPRATPILHESLMLGQEIARKQAGGGPVSAVRQMTSEALTGAREFMPGAVEKAEKKLAGWAGDVLSVVNPEMAGFKARAAGAIVAKAIADRVRSTTIFTRNSAVRRLWWEARKSQVDDFIERFEKGDKFKNDPELAKLADHYRNWNGQIFLQDLDHRVEYDPLDNYLYHVFDNPDEVRRWADSQFGTKWGDPGFLKDRQFSLYREAKNAGFVPKFTNPEDIMLARQHASDIAASKVEALDELQIFGLAIKKPKGVTNFRPTFAYQPRRSPNGEMYYVHNDAMQVVFNAFDSKSLWAAQNLGGSAFRGMMAVKNKIIPLRLGFSLFHALHVLHIANADMTALSFRNTLAGRQGVVQLGVDIVKAAPLIVNGWKNARVGAGVVEAWMGKIGEKELTAADRQNLQFMSEGGFIPIMDHHWNVGAIANFKKGIAQAKGGSMVGGAKAVWHTPWALLEGLQAPLFQQWIPNLKAASYVKNVAEAMRADPELADNPLKRRMAFRRIAQSVDNRYGEMNYETLLWSKWAKDLAVLNTLSLGWQMGFIREYGGGGLDLGQFALRGDKLQAIREGKLDRALFASTYTLTALGYGGLLTWAMTGKPPESLTDYILPRTGGVNADGTPARVNTMFYTREFLSIYKHVQAKGLGEGMTELAESKASGVIGLFAELAKGVNSFGQEIRDPDAPGYKKIEQSLAYVMSDMEPIAFKSAGDAPMRSVLGFTPAPTFMTDSATVGRIKDNYQRFVAPQEKPYDRLQRSKEFGQIRKDYANGKPVGEQLDSMASEFNLSSDEQRRMIRDLNSNQPTSAWMFQRLPWESQKTLLDQMSDEERDAYLPYSNKHHLRGNYVAPTGS